jgi:hypothetical protein
MKPLLFHSVADGFALVEQLKVTGSPITLSNSVAVTVLIGASKINKRHINAKFKYFHFTPSMLL